MEKNIIHCSGSDCLETTENAEAGVKLRYDAYHIPTGYFCELCYESNYPYRKDYYYDYLDAGEYLDDDY